MAMEKNQEYVKEWLKSQYPECLKEANDHEATILFQDESGMQSRPNVRRSWSLKGKRHVITVKEERHKKSISSAASTEGDLYFMIREDPMNGDSLSHDCLSLY